MLKSLLTLQIDFLKHSTAACWLWNLVIGWDTLGLSTVFHRAGDGMKIWYSPRSHPPVTMGRSLSREQNWLKGNVLGEAGTPKRINIKLLSHENQCSKETWAWIRGGSIYTSGPSSDCYSNNNRKKLQPYPSAAALIRPFEGGKGSPAQWRNVMDTGGTM